ncbi:hypothetical protein KY311_00955 [Candidatus Woesearchaeota archaeon]|nr:hypothetical protein [Candidatus Woesearchaeota archaeon]
MAKRESRRLSGVDGFFDVSIGALDDELKSIQSSENFARTVVENPEIDFLARVAQQVTILEAIASGNPDEDKANDDYAGNIYFYKAGKRKGTFNERSLCTSSKGFCDEIKNNPDYSGNPLMVMFAEKIKKLYEKITGQELYQKTVQVRA